ncbi:hypothetical protein [Streptomyces sp. NPDC058548]|uniref:hypothetical protein n=1 Tax=Streptomyces sp. NPDC058548 TaxID=3346545 RepID=UPI00364B1988
MSKLWLNTDVLSEQAEKAGDTTSYAIAIRAGVQPSTMTRLFNRSTSPTLATLVALRDAYQLETIDSLVLEHEKVPA